MSLQDKAEKWDFLIKFSKYLLKSPRLSIERINSKSCSPNILHICPKRSLLSCMDQITIVSSSEQAYQFANFYRGDSGDEAYNAMIIRNVAANANNWFLDWKRKEEWMHVWTNASYSELMQGGLQQITGQSHSPVTYQLCMHLFFNWILNVICNRFFNITLITRSAVYWLSDRIQVIFHGRIFVSNSLIHSSNSGSIFEI